MEFLEGTMPNFQRTEICRFADFQTDYRIYQRRRFNYTCCIPERRCNPGRRIGDQSTERG